MKKQVTARDIANACGVSQATVSYVINNKRGQKIAKETREKILKAVQEMNYYPNASARNMKRKSTSTIGIVCASDYSRQAFLEALEGISEYFSKVHYLMIVFYEGDSAFISEDSVPVYVKSYFSDLIDGLIFFSNSDHDQFIRPAAERDIPYTVICMDGVFSSRSPRPHAFDPALEECARYCRENQLNRIRYFSVDHAGRFVNDKYAAFAAISEREYPGCDLKHVVCPVKRRDLDFDQMQLFVRAYMEQESFDIAICQNYDIGLAVQCEILKRGYQVPQTIKNIFLNNVTFYEMTYPSISGIMIPYREMGSYAARLIISAAAGQEEGFPYQEFSCRLLHRDSTKISDQQ